MGIIFRNDDVGANTNLDEMREMYKVILEAFPDADIWSCVTIISGVCDFGAIYQDVPFKDKDKDWFYKADRFVGPIKELPGKICSHGLYHVDHSILTYDAQQMSILGSCKYLKTDIFVPPFNRYNDHTEFVCDDYGIDLVKRDGWKSLEHEPFNPDHKKWYFHSWRHSISNLKKVLSGNCKNLG